MIILAGPDKQELRREAYAAFATQQLSVINIISTIDEVKTLTSDGLLVLDAALYESEREAAEAVKALAPMQVAVILPKGWDTQPFKQLPNLVTGHSRPVTWPKVATAVRGRLNLPPRATSTTEESTAPTRQSPSKPPHSTPTESAAASPRRSPSKPRSPRARSGRRRPVVRLGFYGTRGGAGVSTAALGAAQALAEAGQTVGLFDATRRGDLHLMAGKTPAKRVQHGKITLFLSAPDEERARQFDAVIVDGGRRRGDFNAEWVEVDNPLSESRVRDLAGLAPVDDDSQSSGGRSSRRPRRRKRGFNLGSLISFELTD